MSKFLHKMVVGIDVSADFSVIAILAPDGETYKKPFRIEHDLDGFRKLESIIKKGEKEFNDTCGIFMESTSTYHKPLFNYLSKEFDTYILNPLVICTGRQKNIRKVKNDQVDAFNIAFSCKYQDLKVSQDVDDVVYTLKMLCREYYNYTDMRSDQIKKLKSTLKVIFPGFLKVFSTLNTKTSLAILEKYPRPDDILNANKNKIIELILDTSKKSKGFALDKYDKLVNAANEAKIIAINQSSLYLKVKIAVDMINQINKERELLIAEIERLIYDENTPDYVATNVELLKSIPGIATFTAITIVSEMGDIKKFKKAKQLVAFFGLDTSVKQSGKYVSTGRKISKRGTSFGRRALYTVALGSIKLNKKGKPLNSVLYNYYYDNLNKKPKKIKLCAIMHKLLNYIFSVLKNQKPYEERNPKLHEKMYLKNNKKEKIA